MKFPEKQQLIILTVIIVLLTGFTLFQYLPMRSKAGVLEQRRNVLLCDNQATSFRVQQLPALYEQLESARKSVDNYDFQIPRVRSHGLFLQQIADVMSRLGLTEQRVKPGLEYDTGQLTCIPIDIQCRGRFNKIFAFFRAIEEFDRLIQIEQVSLNNSSDYGGLVLMRAKANIYYRQEE